MPNLRLQPTEEAIPPRIPPRNAVPTRLPLWSVRVPTKLWWIGVLVAPFVICVTRAYIGLTGIHIYTHDVFVFLDGAWRVLNGQRPHNDFYTPLGPIVYLQGAGGLMLSGGGAEGLAYAQAAFGLLICFWAFALCVRRLEPAPSILVCMALALTSVAPFAIGESPYALTYAMFYNRWGYALLGLLLIESLAEYRYATTRNVTLGGISTGVVVGTLLFLKVSYFLGSVFLLLGLARCRTQRFSRWVGIAGGFGVTFLTFYSYLCFTLAPLWSDLKTAALAKHVVLPESISGTLYKEVGLFLLFILSAALLMRRVEGGLSSRSILTAGFSVSLAGMFLLATNYQQRGFPLNCVLSILVINGVVTSFSMSGRKSLFLRSVVSLLGGLLVLIPISYDAIGLGFGLDVRLVASHVPFTKFNANALASFRSGEGEYVEIVNDGLALVAKYRQPDDTLISLDFSNPVSYSLSMNPSSGGTTWLQYRTNFDDTHGPAPQRVFGSATLVIVPKTFPDAGIARVYVPFLAQNFTLIGEGVSWRLYRRKSSGNS